MWYMRVRQGVINMGTRFGNVWYDTGQQLHISKLCKDNIDYIVGDTSAILTGQIFITSIGIHVSVV